MSRSPRIGATVRAAQIDRVMTALSRRPGSVGQSLSTRTQAEVYDVGGARWAGVSVSGPGLFHTLVATAPITADAAAPGHRLGAGPTGDPAPEGVVHLVRDVARDRRWPVLAT